MNAHAREYDVAEIIAKSPWFQGVSEKALGRLTEAARIPKEQLPLHIGRKGL
jgi:hypothetical protein